MLKKYGGILALFISVLCWGPAPVISKIALAEIPQLSFAFSSRFLALLILAIIFLPKGHFKVDKKDFLWLFLAGVTGATLNVGFFLYGLKLTTAMSSQAIFTTAPIITAILAHFFLKERINRIQIFAVILGFLGAAVIATKDFFEKGSSQSGNLLGDMLIFLAAVSWVFYILLSKRLSKKYSPITITFYSFLVSSVIFAPLAVLENIHGNAWLNNLGSAGIFGILYQSIFSSVIAFSAYQTGIRLTSAFTAGVILYLNPVATTIFAVYILGEKISTAFIIGTLFIITGSLIATQYETLKNHVSKRLNRKTIKS